MNELSLQRPDVVAGRYWSKLDDGRIQCDLCPRECRLREGQRGFCFVRARSEDQMVLTTWGRSSGFCVDPIEKKPLHHFLPGTAVLSFGTAGCNLGCRFCQNWSISKSREVDTLADRAEPAVIARAAAELGCASVAFTYNDPTIFLEYAVDVAQACHEVGLKTVAVTAGYIKEEARREFFDHVDAVNIDLKAFTDDFYRKQTLSNLAPILETIEYVASTDTWMELTTLLIPGHNDSDAELDEMTRWVVEHVGPDVPMHFSAFHPDYKLSDVPRTPPQTLRRAREIAAANGVRYAFTGNVHDVSGDTTTCPTCGIELIVRDWYEIREYRLGPGGGCPGCDSPVAGVFAERAGTWGRKRRPVFLNNWR